MGVARPKNFIDGIPIVRQQQQTPRVLVEAAHRKNPLGIAHIVHHVAANALVGRRGYPLGLIEQQVYGAWLGTRQHLLPVHLHFIAVPNCISKNRNPAVDPHGTRLNGAIRFAAAADAVAAYVLIEACSGFHAAAKVLRYASKRKRRTLRPGATLTYN